MIDGFALQLFPLLRFTHTNPCLRYWANYNKSNLKGLELMQQIRKFGQRKSTPNVEHFYILNQIMVPLKHFHSNTF
jgi:hypothetical protein